jgi:antitoxin CptB
MHADAPFRDTSVGDPSLEGLGGARALDERQHSRIRWRSRRGLLENDLFIQRFFQRHGEHLTVAHARGIYALMDLADNDLLDLLLERRDVPVTDHQDEARLVLALLRQS